MTDPCRSRDLPSGLQADSDTTPGGPVICWAMSPRYHAVVACTLQVAPAVCFIAERLLYVVMLSYTPLEVLWTPPLPHPLPYLPVVCSCEEH